MQADARDARRDLAGQPLLLLMLALYYADPEVEFDAGLSTADLYAGLLDTYARREATKSAGCALDEDTVRRKAADQLHRLAVAALGMFNRGRQHISEDELSADLRALEIDGTGDQLIGEFFFVHINQAHTTRTQRVYEFLHATFAEYLVAVRACEVLLVAVATMRAGARKSVDDELCTLLSHQPLSTQAPVLEFAAEWMANRDVAERAELAGALDRLIAEHRSRPPSPRYTTYQPLEPDRIRATAAYCANLVLLRALALGEENPSFDGARWPRCVALFEAGLDHSAYTSVL
ncbi:hypothetical protein V5P93_004703 [Actinokineospora auranticolor]|uniref:Uncharacterized protein n=1 Tax=Actinokineospora auranticolor TaxID=155976 RepID=A0A2S6GNC0_9PSEU|nr:hypothetical protein [Actinokineospora auranticolor]PPK66666.1 hypothetical protein CLV40_10951 [Actinokineospora auranticolor]